MSKTKIAVSIEYSLIEKIDQMVDERLFPNRSRAIQIAIEEKINRLEKSRLARECAKLDVDVEQRIADEGLTGDMEEWPEY